MACKSDALCKDIKGINQPNQRL